MKMILGAIWATGLMLSGVSVGARAEGISNDQDFLANWYSVVETSIKELPDDEPLLPLNYLDDCAQRELNAGDLASVGSILTTGVKIWKIVESGRPVISLKTPVAHAMPATVKCWMELENWQLPSTKLYQVDYKNLYGFEVVSFKFRIIYNYGGGLGGVGKYLANVAVVPAHVSVAWGFSFNAEVQVGRAINMGSVEDPKAGLQLQVRWGLKTVLKEDVTSENFFVQGDGVLTKL